MLHPNKEEARRATNLGGPLVTTHDPTARRIERMDKVTFESHLWQTLADRGAHFVLADATKRPISTAWQKVKPGIKAVLAHARAGKLVGVIPATLGCAVVDVDKGGVDVIAAIKKKAGRKPSRLGKNPARARLPSLVSVRHRRGQSPVGIASGQRRCEGRKRLRNPVGPIDGFGRPGDQLRHCEARKP